MLTSNRSRLHNCIYARHTRWEPSNGTYTHSTQICALVRRFLCMHVPVRMNRGTHTNRYPVAGHDHATCYRIQFEPMYYTDLASCSHSKLQRVYLRSQLYSLSYCTILMVLTGLGVFWDSYFCARNAANALIRDNCLCHGNKNASNRLSSCIQCDDTRPAICKHSVHNHATQ